MRTFAQTQNQANEPLPSNAVRFTATTPGWDQRRHRILQLPRAIGNGAVRPIEQTSTEECQARLMRAASPGLGYDFSQISIHPALAGAIQTKLEIDEPGDELEQEAERLADRVLHRPESQPEHHGACGGPNPRYQLEQPAWAHHLSRTQSPPARAPADSAGPPIVSEVLQTSGQSLDATTLSFFTRRFGHDLSRVRVHTDSRAAESARAINALAYTVGRDVVFGAGQFSPQSSRGKHLLAHELAHVVQQTTTATCSFPLQRAPDEKKKHRDVAVLGEGWEGGEELARVLAGGGLIIRVKSMDEAAAQLAKIDFPIGTLYFITHSAARGALKFGSDEGYIEPADIAAKLKGLVSAANAPDSVDFRGCSVGTSPKAMGQIRAALGAKSVVAGNCYAVIDRTTPIKIGGKPITRASDVTKENRAEFERLMDKTADKLGAERKCILNPSERGFFAAGGRFVALWFNPDFTGKWVPGKSVCYKSVTPQVVDPDKALAETQDCRLIEVEAKSEGAETKSQGKD